MESLTFWLNGMSLLNTSQQRVMRLAAEGYTNHEIAEQLGLTEGTVKVQMSNCFKSLGLKGKGSRYRMIVARQQAASMPPRRLQQLMSA